MHVGRICKFSRHDENGGRIFSRPCRRRSFFGAEPPKLDAEILGILEQRGKQLGINTRQSGDTSIVLTPSQSYDEETRVVPSAPVTEPTMPVSTPALSIDERLDRIKAATIADTVPAVYTEDEHANDIAAEHGATTEETSAETDMAAPSEETAELVDKRPKSSITLNLKMLQIT